MGHVPSGRGKSVGIGGGDLNDMGALGGCGLGGEAMYGLGSF